MSCTHDGTSCVWSLLAQGCLLAGPGLQVRGGKCFEPPPLLLVVGIQLLSSLHCWLWGSFCSLTHDWMAMTRALIGRYGIERVDLDFLKVGDKGIASTSLGNDVRPWMADLSDINAAGIALAAVGGLFGFIVMHFDQNITVRLVNARDHKLKKGCGYDMDMLALCICTIPLSLLGCPWMVSATVPSLNHCRSLAFYSNPDDKGKNNQDDEQVMEEKSTQVSCRPALT